MIPNADAAPVADDLAIPDNDIGCLGDLNTARAIRHKRAPDGKSVNAAAGCAVKADRAPAILACAVKNGLIGFIIPGPVNCLITAFEFKASFIPHAEFPVRAGIRACGNADLCAVNSRINSFIERIIRMLFAAVFCAYGRYVDIHARDCFTDISRALVAIGIIGIEAVIICALIGIQCRISARCYIFVSGFIYLNGRFGDIAVLCAE